MSWQIVARFTTVAEAEAARSALVASGIETMLGDDELVAVNWRYPVEERCTCCGSIDYYRIDYRRLKAVPLIFALAALPDSRPAASSETEMRDLRLEETGRKASACFSLTMPRRRDGVIQKT